MAEKTHVQKASEQIEALRNMGIPMSYDEQDALLSRAKQKDAEDYRQGIVRREAFLEASLVAYSLSNPKEVLTVECRNCKEKFQTNYKFQKYCSQECLSTAMLQRGLRWDPEKPMQERWHGLPPTTIQPVTLKLLLGWAKEILDQFENPDIYHEREKPELAPYEYSVALPGEPVGPPPPIVLEDET